MSETVTAEGDFLRCYAFTLGEEGGLTDDQNDPGGITNCGWTIYSWSTWRGSLVSADDIRAIVADDTVPAAHALYYNAVRGWGLPAGVSLMVFDHAFNAGVRDSAYILQKLVAVRQTTYRVSIDGKIGAITAGAARACGAANLLPGLRDAQLADYETKQDWPMYQRDWRARLGRRYATACQMAGIKAGEV